MISNVKYFSLHSLIKSIPQIPVRDSSVIGDVFHCIKQIWKELDFRFLKKIRKIRDFLLVI